MIAVTIRKMYRHKDGTQILYEDPAQVNHQRHAENLAARIARDPGVQWVEVQETNGLFKARASRDSDGIVHETLEVKGGIVKRRRGRVRHKFGTRKVLITVSILFLLVLLGAWISAL